MANGDEDWAGWVRQHFPALRLGGFALTSRESAEYNCIAWAARDATRWWWPSIDAYWPRGVPMAEVMESFIAAFGTLGYQPADFNETLEPGFEKVAIYAKPDGRPTHMARQTESGAWASKLGEGCDIEHYSLQSLEGVVYGRAVQILKRQSHTLATNIGHSLKMEMVALPGGEFTMGGDADNSERPRHQVRISPFAIGKYPVTQAQWKAVMGDTHNPSKHKGDSLPVENVSWNDVGEFLEKAGHEFRLPTEAEWEYAARAGSATEYCFGDDGNLLGEYAWFDKNSGGKPHPVGEKKPNPFGLYDMHGNVWEWCSDWYGNSYYAECQRQGSVIDPAGPGEGTYRVRRGGSWGNYAVDCRSASRYNDTPGDRYSDLGFRLVRSVFNHPKVRKDG